MTEYRFARPEEEPQILDLIDLVFSQGSRPHDFRKLLPKVYAHPGFAGFHAVAVRENRIRAVIAMLPLTPEAVATLREEHGIYMAGNGRINIAGLRADTVPVFAQALRPHLEALNGNS